MPEIDKDHFEIATYINTLSVVIYDKRSVYNRGIMTDTHYLIVKNPSSELPTHLNNLYVCALYEIQCTIKKA